MLKALVVSFIIGIDLSQGSDCGKQYLAAKKKQESSLNVVFVPQCEKDGTFKSKQCLDNGKCYCSDRDGNKISNLTTLPLTCKCIRERNAVDKKGLIGAYSPQCKHDGSYYAKQCYGSTGQCWCVNELGEKLSNSTFGLSSCTCLKEQYMSNFKPKCEPDGTYSSMQSHGRYYWCVDSNGIKINNKSRILRSCKCLLQLYTADREGLQKGSFRPKCNTDGTFASMQCHKDHCWCTRLDGTTVPTKTVSSRVCRCLRQEDEIFTAGLAVSLPDCE